MAKYNELIRDFSKIRDYMRDFYIYGFKSRNDFKLKSSRTYDNEKRRIESYMGNYMQWGYSKSGKKSFISFDCSNIDVNPLYASWKSKTFTNNDIVLHFYIINTLKKYTCLNITQLTDIISDESNQIFDTQTIRNKCNKYIKEGLLISKLQNKTMLYSLSTVYKQQILEKSPGIINAIKFFQGSFAFGEIGSFIMDLFNIQNNIFSYKHYYMAHTLEDGILLDILKAMKQNKAIEFVNCTEANDKIATLDGIPLKIFVSSVSGRRYLCAYKTKTNRFHNYRLDHIKSVKILDCDLDVKKLKANLDNNLKYAWGVGFGGSTRIENIILTLHIDEINEGYIIDRIKREGHNGELTRIAENTFEFKITIFDSNDISPWIKTFIGRIIKLDGTNDAVVNRFYNDMRRMAELYDL